MNIIARRLLVPPPISRGFVASIAQQCSCSHRLRIFHKRLQSTLAATKDLWTTQAPSPHDPSAQFNDSVMDSSMPSLPPPTRTSTYQDHEEPSQPVYYPELDPAPFPRDIHSTMRYLNRDIQHRKSNAKGTFIGTHNDLYSFEELDHNTKSTIYRGTLFEYQTQEILKKRLGIYTQRSAGNGDRGIDLRGTWFLPLSASPQPGDMVRHLKVIVQCKMMNAKIGPKYVRELQGSLSFESKPTLAMLAVSSEFTKQAIYPFVKSQWPMALVVIDTENHECKKLMWNKAADDVMLGVHVGTKWVRTKSKSTETRPMLCFKNKPLERLPGPYMNIEEDTGPVYEIEDFSLSLDDALSIDVERPDYLDIVPNDEEGILCSSGDNDMDDDEYGGDMDRNVNMANLDLTIPSRLEIE
ncbi:hypothetical protein BGZ94_008155 [Podila epigama]|nr:hypothetical protein BGZ94_008155 [Podila epigama]